MKVGFYEDINAEQFIDFAYNLGFTAWNSSLTVPSGAEYIGVVVNDDYVSNAFAGTTDAYVLWQQSYRQALADDMYINGMSEISDRVCNTEKAISGVKTMLNRIDEPDNMFADTRISTTTGLKLGNHSGETLYMISVNEGDVLYLTQCNSSIMQIGFYEDINAEQFVDFAYNLGFRSWNSNITVPANTEYIGIVVKDEYADNAFFDKYINYQIWARSYRQKLADDMYIGNLDELKNDYSGVKNNVLEVMGRVEKSVNLFDFSKASNWGSWCNYTNGQIQSTEYVTTYAYSDYIEVKPNTSYARQTGVRGSVFFDADKTYIGYSRDDTFTTPANCKYVIINISNSDSVALYTMLIERSTAITSSEPFIPYYYGFEVQKRDYITCGIGGEYATIKQGLEEAIARDCPCVILPGSYDLVEEGISGKGYILPKKTYGYGATLICRPEAEDWNLSPLNVSTYSTGAEVYGLTVIAANCRYCIHDDMGAMTKAAYHNKYKDLHLIHESAISETLLAPQCIGGGFGQKGMIEIESCIFEATIRDVSYHSASSGSQTGNSVLRCKDSVFSHTFTATNIGSSTDFMNTVYLCGCKMASLPNTTPTANTQIIEWNNSIA